MVDDVVNEAGCGCEAQRFTEMLLDHRQSVSIVCVPVALLIKGGSHPLGTPESHALYPEVFGQAAAMILEVPGLKVNKNKTGKKVLVLGMCGKVRYMAARHRVTPHLVIHIRGGIGQRM